MRKKKFTGKLRLSKTWLIVLGILGVMLVGIFGWFRYEDYQLGRGLDKIVVPTNWEKLETKKEGNRLCSKTCPAISSTYSAPGINEDNALSVFKSIVSNSRFELKEASCIEGISVGGACNVSANDGGMRFSINLVKLNNQSNILMVYGHRNYLWGLYGEDTESAK